MVAFCYQDEVLIYPIVVVGLCVPPAGILQLLPQLLGKNVADRWFPADQRVDLLIN